MSDAASCFANTLAFNQHFPGLHDAPSLNVE
jgi:hypothetical protein